MKKLKDPADKNNDGWVYGIETSPELALKGGARHGTTRTGSSRRGICS